ncbi:34774_t:CDS:2, partial [Racocetra persica]
TNQDDDYNHISDEHADIYDLNLDSSEEPFKSLEVQEKNEENENIEF